VLCAEESNFKGLHHANRRRFADATASAPILVSMAREPVELTPVSNHTPNLRWISIRPLPTARRHCTTLGAGNNHALEVEDGPVIVNIRINGDVELPSAGR
jgi:hypothetical protein